MEEIAANANEYSKEIIDLIWIYGPKVITALLTLIVGLWIIGILTRSIGKGMDKRNVDPSLKPFIKSLINAVLKVMLIISVIGMVGIQATSFVAVLGAAEWLLGGTR